MPKRDFCAAVGCLHIRCKDSCSFYSFPKDEELRKKWVHAVKRVEIVNEKKRPWKPTKNSKLCSCHFVVQPKTNSFLKIKRMAVPTVFKHNKKSPRKPRRPPRERSSSHALKSVSNKIASRKQVEFEGEVEVEVKQQQESDSISLSSNTFVEDKGQVILLESGHDYLHSYTDKNSYQPYKRMDEQDPGFWSEFEELKKKAELYDNASHSGQLLSLENIKNNDQLFDVYTGIPNYGTFQELYKYLEAKATCLQYFRGSETKERAHFTQRHSYKPGRKRTLSPQEELFLFLVRIRTGNSVQDLSIRFGISETTFNRVFTTWSCFLSLELENLCKMATSKEHAKCFDDFKNVRIIIDCTELFSETPSSLNVHKQFFSNYKHHSTIKFLVGISPSGSVTYVSSMYGGHASDKYITNDSDDFLNALQPGEAVMADRGFTISDDLPVGVKLIIPAFKGKDRTQLSKAEVLRTKEIASARVHVERAMRRIKQFRFLQQCIRMSQIDVYEQVFKVCAYLLNFQNPFLKVL